MTDTGWFIALYLAIGAVYVLGLLVIETLPDRRARLGATLGWISAIGTLTIISIV